MIEDIYFLEENIYILIDELYEDNLEQNREFIVEAFNSYSKFLKIFSEFLDIANVLDLLSISIVNVDFTQTKKNHLISDFIKAIFDDLINWKNNVFVDKIAVDVFYINASLYSSYLELNKLINKDKK
jgi:hypothetical protein